MFRHKEKRKIILIKTIPILIKSLKKLSTTLTILMTQTSIQFLICPIRKQKIKNLTHINRELIETLKKQND